MLKMEQYKTVPLRYACFTLCLCGFVTPAISQPARVRLDSSDWWSTLRQEELPAREPRQPIKFQKREPAEANFQIAGLRLGATWDFKEIRSRFGEGTEVERGDAASGRNQICYVDPSGDMYLVFELGEVDSALYLFEDGPKWNRSELCAISQTISPNISTTSGLRLGLAPQEVKSVLGSPNVESSDKLAYYFDYKKKTPAEVLAKFRRENPTMGDAEFAKNFEYADGEAYIEARFVTGKLKYLAISRSETY